MASIPRLRQWQNEAKCCPPPVSICRSLSSSRKLLFFTATFFLPSDIAKSDGFMLLYFFLSVDCSGEVKMNFEVGGFTDLKSYRNALSMVKKELIFSMEMSFPVEMTFPVVRTFPMMTIFPVTVRSFLVQWRSPVVCVRFYIWELSIMYHLTLAFLVLISHEHIKLHSFHNILVWFHRSY